jgi:hypothetical protein
LIIEPYNGNQPCQLFSIRYCCPGNQFLHHPAVIAQSYSRCASLPFVIAKSDASEERTEKLLLVSLLKVSPVESVILIFIFCNAKLSDSLYHIFTLVNTRHAIGLRHRQFIQYNILHCSNGTVCQSFYTEPDIISVLIPGHPQAWF